MAKAEIIKITKKFHEMLKKNGINVKKIILFGSYAIGKSRKDSDIDLAVVSSDFGIDRYEEGTKLFKIACKVDPRIEPVPLSMKSYLKDTWLPLIYEIRTKGIEISI